MVVTQITGGECCHLVKLMRSCHVRAFFSQQFNIEPGGPGYCIDARCMEHHPGRRLQPTAPPRESGLEMCNAGNLKYLAALPRHVMRLDGIRRLLHALDLPGH